jgi:arylamine N-acetyltransferase
MLSDALLISFLRHLGLPPTGTPEQLLTATLHGFARIPYENLTKIIAHAEAGDGHRKQSPQELIHGFIHHGTGGTCFSLTLTLVHFLKVLGFEAAPILADRRYGADTHCAVLVKATSHSWCLLDPGYLISTPCLLPSTTGFSACRLRYDLPHGALELWPTETPDRIDLYTIAPVATHHAATPRYRLTYKTTPVDDETFERAWDRSFSWEMMTYPIVSAVVDTQHIYLQKDTLYLRSPTGSTRVRVTAATVIRELAPRLGISAKVVRRALVHTVK